jgi:Mannosyltransferase (PIG-V)
MNISYDLSRGPTRAAKPARGRAGTRLRGLRTHPLVAWCHRWRLILIPIAAFLVLRIIFSVDGLLTLLSQPPLHTAQIHDEYLGYAPLHDLIVGPWQRFDALWYVRISQRGYLPGDGSTVYFPLYPALIRLLTPLCAGNAFLAAFLVANLACVGFFIAFFRFVHDRYGMGRACLALIALCTFPTSVFLTVGYTEPLFFFLSVGSLLAYDRQRPALAGALAALAALTRLQGILLVIPFFWGALQRWRAGTPEARQWLPLVCPPLGVAVFFAYTRVVVHSAVLTTVYRTQWGYCIVHPPGPPSCIIGVTWGRPRGHGSTCTTSPSP